MTAAAIYRSARRQVLRRTFERGRLEDTYGVVSLESLDVAHPDRYHYEPSGWTHLSRALRGRPIAPGDVFLDYGSGKGRIIQQAARRPFARVLGIEISADLSAVARRNIANNRERLACADVTIECVDVADFEVPDDVTHAYLYNSFVGPTFGIALDGLARSHDRRPRPITLIYVHPVLGRVLEAHPRFELDEILGRRGRIDRRVHIYTVIAPSGGRTL